MRGRVSTSECPVSYVTSESRAFIEEFHAWKLFGEIDYYRLPARLVEAMFILENELMLEQSNAQE